MRALGYLAWSLDTDVADSIGGGGGGRGNSSRNSANSGDTLRSSTRDGAPSNGMGKETVRETNARAEVGVRSSRDSDVTSATRLQNAVNEAEKGAVVGAEGDGDGDRRLQDKVALTLAARASKDGASMVSANGGGAMEQAHGEIAGRDSRSGGGGVDRRADTAAAKCRCEKSQGNRGEVGRSGGTRGSGGYLVCLEPMDELKK